MSSNTQFENFVPVYPNIPESWEEARGLITERMVDVTEAVNTRDYGLYSDAEIQSGQQWATSINTKDVFRKVIDLGSLPNFGVTNPYTVAHGITLSSNACITRFYGTASSRSGGVFSSGISLPYVDSADTLALEINATNIVITSTNATDFSAYDCAYVVVEWTDEG